MTVVIIIIAVIAVALFGLAAVFRAKNAPEIAKAKNERQKQRQSFLEGIGNRRRQFWLKLRERRRRKR